MSRHVRVVALGLVFRDDEVLVSRLRDSEADETFYRPIGGGVEFGEHSRETVVREFDEELEVTFAVDGYVGTFEDVFTFDGTRGHEVQRIYEGRIEEDWPYEREEFEAYESDVDERFAVEWMDPETFRDGSEAFYPEALISSL